MNNRELNPLLRRLMILAGVSAGVYALNRLLLIPMFPEIRFFKEYLGDMMALPVYLPLSFYLAWRLRLIPGDFQLQYLHIVGAGLIFSILFEGIIPMIDTTSTRDLYDILAYFAGGLVVYRVGSKTSQKSISNTKD